MVVRSHVSQMNTATDFVNIGGLLRTFCATRFRLPQHEQRFWVPNHFMP